MFRLNIRVLLALTVILFVVYSMVNEVSAGSLIGIELNDKGKNVVNYVLLTIIVLLLHAKVILNKNIITR